MRGVCAGVAYLHDHGIVHRDLKPGNIFSDEGTVKIGDYGLAKFISCSRRSGQTESVGTVHYMAPEIANGRYGREIDTYALGVILFEMLTGRVPFEGESVGEVLMKHLTAEPDLATLGEPYRGIVERALAKDPNVRIDSVSELVALLPAGGDHVVLTPVPKPAPPLNAGTEAAAASASPSAPDSPFRHANRAREEANKARKEIYQQVHGSASADSDAAIEEPLWKAIRSGASYVRRRWVGEGVQPMPVFHKALLTIATILMVFWFTDDVFGIGIQVLILYCIYFVIWTSLIKPNLRRQNATPTRPTSPAAAAFAHPAEQKTAAWPTTGEVRAAAVAKPTLSGRRVRPSWRERAHRELAEKPLRAKLQELVGSMLLAAVFAAIASSIAPLLWNSQPASENVATYLWLALVGTIGSWAILIPAKFSEGKLEDQVPMRLALLLLGALVGAVAWWLAEALLLNTPSWGDPISIDKGFLSNELLKWPTQSQSSNDMSIGIPYFIAYFAFLFLLPRWWRQAEFTRSGRLSLWSVLVCVGWGWLLHFFWWFPQPQGMMAAGVIALATQLASPWMPPSRRRTLAAEIEGGVA
jgi:hypothetical protein